MEDAFGTRALFKPEKVRDFYDRGLTEFQCIDEIVSTCKITEFITP